MVGRLVGGVMNLARPVEYLVQIGWTVPISFEWLLPLTGFRATKSSVDRCIFSFIIVVPMLVFVTSWLFVAIPGLRSVRVTGTVASTSQPAIFARAEAGHECGKNCHGLRLFLTEVSGEPFVTDAVFKGR